MPNTKFLQSQTFDITHFLIYCYRKVTELMGISPGESFEIAMNSAVCKSSSLKKLAGFDF